MMRDVEPQKRKQRGDFPIETRPQVNGVWTKVRRPRKLPVYPEGPVPRVSPWGPRMERPLVRFLVALALGDGVNLGR